MLAFTGGPVLEHAALRTAAKARLVAIHTAALRLRQRDGAGAVLALCAAVALLALILGLGWMIDAQVQRVAMEHATARANDEVALGLLGQLTQEDFQPPFDANRLEHVSQRLEPVLSRLAQPESGILRVNVISPNGTILYSDVTGLRGELLPTDDNQHLAAALRGLLSAHRSSLGSAENRDLRQTYESAIEVYVPVRMGDRVVGAYEIYLDAASLRATQPLVWGGLLAVWLVSVVGSLFVLGLAAGRNRRSEARRRPTVVNGAARAGRLTPRELQVLRLMADHTTREIGRELVLSEDTVRTHVKNILKKLDQPSRTLAVLAAVRGGLLEISDGSVQPPVQQ
jgi:DNA-binding CsgD family transcriptional regulator